MLSLKFVRENPEIVKQNIRNKFQDAEAGPMVDEVIELDAKNRAAQAGSRQPSCIERNKLSKQIGAVDGPGQEGRGRGSKAAGNCQCRHVWLSFRDSESRAG